jgi:hypothetical protein
MPSPASQTGQHLTLTQCGFRFTSPSCQKTLPAFRIGDKIPAIKQDSAGPRAGNDASVKRAWLFP